MSSSPSKRKRMSINRPDRPVLQPILPHRQHRAKPPTPTVNRKPTKPHPYKLNHKSQVYHNTQSNTTNPKDNTNFRCPPYTPGVTLQNAYRRHYRCDGDMPTLTKLKRYLRALVCLKLRLQDMQRYADSNGTNLQIFENHLHVLQMIVYWSITCTSNRPLRIRKTDLPHCTYRNARLLIKKLDDEIRDTYNTIQATTMVTPRNSYTYYR